MDTNNNTNTQNINKDEELVNELVNHEINKAIDENDEQKVFDELEISNEEKLRKAWEDLDIAAYEITKKYISFTELFKNAFAA